MGSGKDSHRSQRKKSCSWMFSQRRKRPGPSGQRSARARSNGSHFKQRALSAPKSPSGNSEMTSDGQGSGRWGPGFRREDGPSRQLENANDAKSGVFWLPRAETANPDPFQVRKASSSIAWNCRPGRGWGPGHPYCEERDLLGSWARTTYQLTKKYLVLFEQLKSPQNLFLIYRARYRVLWV